MNSEKVRKRSNVRELQERVRHEQVKISGNFASHRERGRELRASFCRIRCNLLDAAQYVREATRESAKTYQAESAKDSHRLFVSLDLSAGATVSSPQSRAYDSISMRSCGVSETVFGRWSSWDSKLLPLLASEACISA